jgi:general secretion pathway protein A
MYEAHYGFTEKPFNLTPDPKYLYLSQRHTEAFAHLEYGRQQRGGFITITGEVGTGKTTLARYFLSRVDAKTATAVVLYPAISAEELLRSILQDLKIPISGTSLKDHVDALHRYLLRSREEGRDVVLLIDEAQALAPEVLEQVRLISNLETDTEKLIQIVLMGQSELQEMLGRRELRQLAQRVTARYHLSPLSRREVEDYVRHRLVVAGGAGKVTFTEGALASVHKISGGIPRLVNLICDRSLLSGYVQGTRVITAPMVKGAAREVLGDEPARKSWLAEWRPAAAAAGLVVMAGLAALAWPRSAVAPGSPEPPPSTAAPGLAVPRVVPAPVPAAAGGDLLSPLLLSLPRDASRQHAVGDIQALWGEGALEQTPLRTHLEQVRRLDLPVVLEMFHPTRRDTCSLALLHLEGDAAVVSAGGQRLRVPVALLDRFWTRQATFLWRDFESLGVQRDPARTATWAQEALARYGYPVAGDLAAAVSRFQSDVELTPDGVVGARTLMALYSRATTYARPRLSGGLT